MKYFAMFISCFIKHNSENKTASVAITESFPVTLLTRLTKIRFWKWVLPRRKVACKNSFGWNLSHISCIYELTKIQLKKQQMSSTLNDLSKPNWKCCFLSSIYLPHVKGAFLLLHLFNSFLGKISCRISTN